MILQGHSYMDEMSWFADMEEPAERQTSREKITVVSFCEKAAVRGRMGDTRQMMRVQRSNTLVFLIGNNLNQLFSAVNFKF